MLQADVVTALGAMSGTSLDGVDAAVLRTDGVAIHSFGPSAYRPYSDAERAVLKAHLGRWQEDDCAEAAKVVETAHLDVFGRFSDIDLIGFHGQTLAHDPSGRRTHQCGNGQRLSDTLGLPIVWDFRSADVAAGGQGAPLAPFYHFALAKWIKATAPIAFLNLGGVGNITWVNPACAEPTDAGALLAFDTGPGNAPMNDTMLERAGKSYDEDGAIAADGSADKAIIAEFLNHPYFQAPAPKSLDRDAFAALTSDVSPLDLPDVLATLAAIVVETVARAMTICPSPPAKLLVTGGGRHNKTLMAGLSQRLACTVAPVEAVGLDGDMLEAQAFAFLAVRAAKGLPISAPPTTGVPHPMRGGILAHRFKTET